MSVIRINTFTQQKCIFYPLFCIGFFIVLSFFLLPDYSRAATEQISLIRQDCTGYTGCYTSLSAWEAAQQRDLVASDKIAVAKIDGAWTLPDTTLVIISGWTTDATHYIKIYTTTAARHTGKWDDTKYRLENGTWGAHIIDNQQNFTTIEGVQILHSGGGSSSSGIYSVDFAGVIVKDSIIKKSSAVTGQGIMITGTPIASSGVVNSIAYGGWDQGIDVAANGGYGYAYNTTSYGNNYGYNGFYIQNLKNCIGASNTIADFARTGTYAVNTTTCASSGPTANTFTDTGSRINQTFSFVDPLNGDFHLQSTDTAAKDFGTTLSTDSIHAFATDIDGQTRTAPWDIGADEYVSGVADTTPPTIPTSLTATAISSSQINLSWTASTDTVGVTGYKIYRGGVQIATSLTTTYADTALSASTAYTYTISAYDAASNTSAQSGSASATTQAPSATPSGAPVLNFSDLTSGPKTGLGDDLGSGAIVTIWGVNLGSSQGTSKVYIGNVEAAFVYEWTNATQHPGHPADLYTYHRMQTIAFSVPATAIDGANTIKVVVNGVTSNTLPFTVRAGNIYFVKTTGVDTGNGSGTNGGWNNPWRNINYYSQTLAGVAAGSILYVGNGITATTRYGILFGGTQGSAANPYAVVAYPGAVVSSNGASSDYPQSNFQYAHLSKIKLYSNTGAYIFVKKGRAIALEIVDDPTNPCLASQSALVTGAGAAGYTNGAGPDGIVFLGNYIHDYCQNLTDSQQHTTYFSNRSGTTYLPFEVGWNYLSNNMSDHGIHVYDEGVCGGWSGTVKIHDNVVVNQRGFSIGINPACGVGYGPVTTSFEIFNNLVVDGGRGPYFLSNGSLWSVGMSFGTGTGFGAYSQAAAQYTMKAYNNTVYGVGETVRDIGSNHIDGLLNINPYFGSLDLKNNVFVDTKNWPWITTISSNPTTSANNLWYSTTTGHVGPPSWDTAPLTSNPLFANPAGFDFRLQTGSPAIDAGINLLTTIARDFLGIPRPQGTAFDIGAFEYNIGSPYVPPTDTTPPTIPTSLTATAISSSQINLSWTASTDTVGVTGYKIYRGGVQIATSLTTTYADTALSASTAYTYTISAYDAASNTSAQSPSASATTQAVQVITTTSGAPVLNFSDIVSGPKISNTDGLGSGAIVSIWGGNLGSSQGASQIYVGGIPAAHVYYWGNADGNKNAGPADLYAVQKMQTISFSIPATAVDGVNTIYVTVGGQQSNALPFTVRTGNIYFVKTTGSDSAGNGSWNNPLRTMVYVGDGSGNAGAGGKVKAGDIVYVGDGITESQGLPIKYIDGTPSMPVSLIAYPGAQVVILGPSGYGIGPHMHASAYWNFSKLTIKTTGDGIDTFRGMRAVANEITNYPGAYANGQGGAITGDNYNFPFDPAHDIVSGIKNFGNYIHDFGGPTTDKLHHIFYISNRGGLPAEAFELGWNYIRDNGAYHALHVYDEGRCGDFTGTIQIHDNVVKNQVGVGFGVSSGGSTTCISAPINVYNNLFINVGAKLSGTDSYHSYAIGMSGSYTKSHVRIYNNTFYGFSDATAVDPAFFPDMSNAMGPFGGSWEFVNNIVINTNNVPYRSTNGGFAFVNPALATNNIWYSPGGTQPSPSWETNQITTNPLFINQTLSDLHLQSASPAIDMGSSLVSAIVTRDLNGNPRPQGSSWDIGAYEYISSYTPPSDTISPTTITNLSISNIGQTSLALSWTAPSDSSGVSSYDIRYNTSLITDATFPTSTQVSSIPVPSVPGTVQQLYISIGLTPGTTYYFAIKSTDSARNVSQLSNIPSATALSAPSAQSGAVSIPSSGAGSGGGSAIYQVSGSQVPASPSHIQINPTNIQISSSSIQEGSLIRGPDHIKVYIVNAHGYKRHIFNSAVFNMYGHFKWDQIRDVDQGTLNAYQTSDLYRADGDAKVFSLKELDESKGLAQKRWFNLSGNAFLQKGYTFNQVFIINSKERDYYQEGTPITDNATTFTLPALVKIKDNPQIYFISDKGIKKPILNELIFNSYKSNRWQDVKEISPTELDHYTAFQGILYQGKVYTINQQAQTKQLVKNLDAFNQLNLDWSKIMPVNEVEMRNWK